MINVAICDDERIFREELRGLLEEYSKNTKLDMIINYFESGEQLLDCKEEFDLYFIDNIMVGIDGIETAKVLRTRKIDVPIVFLTNYKEAMQNAFTVRAYRYLIKEDYKSELYKCLDDYKKDHCVCVIINQDNNSYRVMRISSILHIASAHNGSELWTSEGIFDSVFSLNEWGDILDNNIFFRCHKNSIVNLGYIKKVENIIELTNDERVELSRRNKKKLKESLLKFISLYAR